MPPKKPSARSGKPPALEASPLAASPSTSSQENPSGPPRRSTRQPGTGIFGRLKDLSKPEADTPVEPEPVKPESSTDTAMSGVENHQFVDDSTVGGTNPSAEDATMREDSPMSEDEDMGDDDANQAPGTSEGDKPDEPQGVGEDRVYQDLSRALPTTTAPRQPKAANLKAHMKVWKAQKRGREPTEEPTRKAVRSGTLDAGQAALRNTSQSASSSYAQTAARPSNAMAASTQQSTRPTTVAPVTNPSVAPAPVLDIAPPPSRIHPALPYKELYKYGSGADRKVRVAVHINNGKHFFGNPWSSTKGYSINLFLDAGRFGDPCLTLKIKIVKGNKNAPMPADEAETNIIQVSWYPGWKFQEHRNITDFQFVSAWDEPDSGIFDKKGIKDTCPANARDGLDALVAIRFQTESHLHEHYDPAWIHGLPGDAAAGIHALVTGKDRSITLWFVNPKGATKFDTLSRHLLQPFRWAVEVERPSYAQYLDEDGNFNVSLEICPTIEEIGGGMYKKTPKQVTDKGKGQALQNLDEEVVESLKFDVLPKVYFWKALREFEIYCAMHSVRERQYVKGQYASIGIGAHHVFIQKFPTVLVEHALLTKLSPEQRNLRKGLLFFVRMRRAPDGKKDLTPAEGQRIEFALDNSNPEKPHTEVPRDQRYYGTVIPTSAETAGKLKDTATDFCAFVTKGSKAPIGRSHLFLTHREDRFLPRFRLEVTVNDRPVLREIEAVNNMANEEYCPEMLAPIRAAVISDPNGKTWTETDLTEGTGSDEQKAANRASYKGFIATYCDHLNPAREEVLLSVKSLKNRIGLVTGAPGTLKTSTVAAIVAGLTTTGQKILFTAAANAAVDAAANALYNVLPKGKRCVRIEVSSLEREAILKQEGYSDPVGLDRKKPAPFKPASTPMDDPAILHQWDKIVAELDENAEAMQKFYDQLENHQEAVEQIRANASTEKSTNVPLEMTLGYCIYDRIRRDEEEARVRYEKKLSELGDEVQRSQFRSEKSLDDFDDSLSYRECIQLFVIRNGSLSSEENDHFDAVRERMIGRVLKDMDVVFTTCNNSGNPVIADRFEPDINCIDEAGQLTLPAFCVPLTAYKTWKGLLIFGDVNQLKPLILSTGLNEFVSNAKLSAMALLLGKGFPRTVLNMQYRSDPEIIKFPAEQFYAPGELINHPSTFNNHPTKDMVRAVSESHFGFPKGKGSVYFMVDVSYGTARFKPNSTSLQNYANAEAIAECVLVLFKGGLRGSQITILATYRGQIPILYMKIRDALADDDGDWEDEASDLKITTVDSYQGRDAEVVLIDLVAATDQYDAIATRQKKGMTYSGITAHVKEANRLNVSLTRAKYGCILFGQAVVLLDVIPEPKPGQKAPNRSKRSESVGMLVRDAGKRGLLVSDDKHFDTHPVALERRALIPDMVRADGLRRSNLRRYGFISDRITQQHKAKETVEEVPAPRTMRTDAGATTELLTGDASAIINRTFKEKRIVHRRGQAMGG